MYTLLIVDDEPNILEGISMLLDWEALGFDRIFTAKSCFEVISHIEMWRPDLCLVDVRIGNEYGYELIKWLRETGVKSNYIMMSGYDDFQYACEAIRCGAQDYLLKPIERQKLQERVEQIIVEQLHGTLQEKEKKNTDPVLGREYDKMSSLIRKIVMIVGMEYGQHVSLRSMGERFHMNATYLGQIFIKETDMKFSEYLMAYRLYVAKEKIIHTDEKIFVIASDVGYSNMNYFYQHFHNYYKITPSEMRAKFRK